MLSFEQLRHTLARLDGRGYKAYKDIEGAFRHERFVLFIDHVQGDPFASPSKIRVRVPQSVAGLPSSLFANRVRRIALQDFLTRTVHRAIRQISHGHRGMGKSGLIAIDVGGQEVLERTAVVITDQWVEARLHVGLPAQGRTILGRQAEAMLCQELPQIVHQGLCWNQLDYAEGERFVSCVENQEAIRSQLDERGLIAFVGDGAILPRASGASEKPLVSGQVQPFRSPDSLRVTFSLPNPIDHLGHRTTTITGMGIPKGVTLIVGGGYHGKSTLLRALERGVYPHIPGDGREWVVTSREAMKIRAEDGRRIERVDISGFITNLPFGQDTTQFSTDNASGSTSQAASILEALEVGATALLLDEDTSATNFMVRDARMQALVNKAHEPITPFLDRVRELYQTYGVSTILVMGGCGDYFDVADTVIMMREYLPHDVTQEAHHIAKTLGTNRQREVPFAMPPLVPRIPLAESIDPSRGRREVKIDTKALDLILFGEETLDLHAVEQLVDISQTRAIGCAIHLAAQRFMDDKQPVREIVRAIDQLFDKEGLDLLDPFHRAGHHPGNFARPRPLEIAAALNRLRSVRMRQQR
ncbi:MAG: ATPase [Nitrospirae bacterium]|nr:MAG: ATPase [Nitrospirota bacterium]